MSPPFLWWSEEIHRDEGTPVIVKMENPNWSISEVSSPEYDDVSSHLNGAPADPSRKAPRRKNAKQLTWVLLLRAHRAAGCLASLALAFRTHLCTLRRRSSFVGLMKALALMTVAVVLFEFVGYARVWRFGAASEVGEKLRGVDVGGVVGVAKATWAVVRSEHLGPFLQVVSNVCVVMFLVQSADRVVMCMGAFWIRVRGLKPILPSDDLLDLESGENGFFPMVLVQIPMCNEREVYRQSIGAVCNLDWPRMKLMVQVLDDSDDPITQVLIKEEVATWQQNGARIVYRHRELREGYKAGNLKSAMSCNYVKDYEFVAIFDADFQPQPDFLKKTIPHFKGREELGLVQARWSFINGDENLLTRLQNINLSFHFEVEQQVNGHYLNFFGFNGTAGVWRIRALQDAGGWLERTTVEDMDIAVRAHLRGWKFIFINDVECQCELPESYEAYKKQQHRWHSGPMQLFRLCFKDIIKSNIGFWKKSNLIFLFFLIRKLILPLYSFTLFCIILPMTMFVPEVELPTWVICYIPATMSFLNVLPSPRSFPFMIPYLLFENTMSVTKFQAMLSGLMGRAYEWVVTKKLGRSSASDLEFLVDKERKLEHSMSMPNLNMAASEEIKIRRKSKKKPRRIYKNEVMLAFLLLAAAVSSLISMEGMHFYFLLFQGISFLLVGFDMIGEHTG